MLREYLREGPLEVAHDELDALAGAVDRARRDAEAVLDADARFAQRLLAEHEALVSLTWIADRLDLVVDTLAHDSKGLLTSAASEAEDLVDASFTRLTLAPRDSMLREAHRGPGSRDSK